MKSIVLVATVLVVALGTQAIIVLDNTTQANKGHDVIRRRPTITSRESLHHIDQQQQPAQQRGQTLSTQVQQRQRQYRNQQEQQPQQQTAAESKSKGFRSVVVHKPTSAEDDHGGLIVQDPPKGWPFSEINMAFNGHMSDEELSESQDVVTSRPEDNEPSQQNQLQLQVQRNFRQQQQNQQLTTQQQQQLFIQQHHNQQLQQQETYQQQLQQQQHQLQQQQQHHHLQQQQEQQQQLHKNQVPLQHTSIQPQVQNSVNPQFYPEQHQRVPMHHQPHTPQAQPLTQPQNQVIEPQVVIQQPVPPVQHHSSHSHQYAEVPRPQIQQNRPQSEQLHAQPQSHVLHQQNTMQQSNIRQNYHENQIPENGQDQNIVHIPRPTHKKPPSTTEQHGGHGPETNEHTPSRKVPRTRHQHVGSNPSYNIGFTNPSDAFAHSNQMLDLINKDPSSSQNRLTGDGNGPLPNGHANQQSQIQQAQQNIQQHNIQQHNSIPSAQNIPQQEVNTPSTTQTLNSYHQNAGAEGDPNYVWRDIGQGLEISSNVPSQQNTVVSSRTPHALVHEQPSNQKVGQGTVPSGQPGVNNIGQAHVTHYFPQVQTGHVGQVQNFDHANALGHSDNFGYRDAIVPAQFQTLLSTGLPQQHSVNQGFIPQPSLHGVFGQQPQTAVQDSGKSISKSSNVFTAFKKNPTSGGTSATHAQYNLGGNQAQSSPVQSTVGSDGNQKVVLKVNKGFIPGSLVLGNGVHLGYAAANIGQGSIFSHQGSGNSAANGAATQSYYLPQPGIQSSQTNGQSTLGHGIQQSVGHIQQGLVAGAPGAIHAGYINTASLPYIGSPAQSGSGSLPVLHGNLLGVQSFPGLGGTQLSNSHLASIYPGGNYASLASGSQTPIVGAIQGNIQQPYYATQSGGVQQYTYQLGTGVQNGHQVGRDSFNYNNIPYQYQQLPNQQNQIIKSPLNLNPSGFGLKIQQQHPIPQQNSKPGVQVRAPGNGVNHPLSTSFSQIYSHSNPLAKGYQPFPSPGAQYQPALSPNKPITTPGHHRFQQPGVVKREENFNRPITKVGDIMRDKRSHGWTASPIPLKHG